jgi:hypothetical protein
MVFGLWFLVFDFNSVLSIFPQEKPEMEKTNFVNLHIYKLSEQLADEI